MIIPDAAVSFVLENVTEGLKYNYNLIAGVRDNILALQRELQTLRAQMKDFILYNHDSSFIEDTVNQIRTVIGQAEDAVDTYLLQVAVQRSRDKLSKVFHKYTDYPIVLRDVGKQIEKVSELVKEINEKSIKNGLKVLKYQAIAGINRSENSREAPKVEEEHVIGFDGAAKDVAALLTGGSEQLEVISIVGMLGLGKTTLARKVFKDPKVDYEFMLQAFVYVSKEYKKREVLLNILSAFKLISDEARKMTEVELESHFQQQLEGKQYLVVMDDVWETEDWDKFKSVFPKNKKRCRVLVTTRNEAVARHANPVNPESFYKLDFLPLEESRKLLRWKVFNEDKCPEVLIEHEINIAKKCDGLPLAIVVIAGIIVNHPDRVDWWRDVANSVRDYIARDQNEAKKVIQLMYKHLPNHLKLLFLYLGVFGEDVEIPVWKLVRLWIGEGFIQQEGTLNLEDKAEQYLEELVYRNLVMVGQRRSNEKIKTCRMHDTLRDFCKNEALKETLFEEINEGNLSYFTSTDPALSVHRRLCINNNVLDYISKRPSGDRVRSFLTFVKQETLVEPKLVPCIPKTFKLLRVLEIQSLSFTRFPADLCSLVLLKYIAISSNFTTLPQALSILWNLQTLIVKTTSPTLDIKADIWKMPQFRHLHANASTTLPSPPGDKNKSGGQNVQTLSTISPESCKREVFERTARLKKLGICGAISRLFEVNGESSLFSYLRKLEFLENLKLLNDESSPRLYSLPSEKSFPKKLTSLTLLNTQLDWEEMSTLGKVESLEVLKLKQYAFKGILWKTQKDGFLRLKHLFIGRTDLVSWEVSADNFPKLKSLELNGCDQLQAFPHGLGDIPTLQSVVLHCTNPSVASSARKLQVLKLQEANMGYKNNFKLSVFPPDH